MKKGVVFRLFLLLFVIAPLGILVNAQNNSAGGASDNSEEVAMLTGLYRACLSPELGNTTSLYAKFLTKAMQEKVWRMSYDSDINPVIRAQDIPEDSCETLKIEPLEDSWYMVSYIMGKGTEYEDKVAIPVKVVREDGEYRVGYIVPYYLGQTYGDNLWYSGDTYPAVDRSEPFAFVKSFYALYMAKSGSLFPGLSRSLAEVRAEYLTPKALKQFAEAEKSYLLDGYEGYDLLLHGFNFEYSCSSSLKVVPLEGKEAYSVSYEIPGRESPETLRVEVVKQEGKYYIDGIYDKENGHFGE